MIHIPKEKIMKWDKKAERGILVGYPDDVKGYRVYNLKTKQITTSRDVIIVEKPLVADEVSVPIQEIPADSLEVYEDSVGVFSDCSDNEDILDETYVPEEDSSDSSMESIVSVGRRDVACRQRQQLDRYGLSNACIGHNIKDNSEISLDEALKGPEKE